jgi:hypothetical protein
MPQPVSSSSGQSPGIASDPTLDDPSRADPPNSSPPEPVTSQAPGVTKLVSALPGPSVALPPAFADYGLSCGAHDSLFSGVVPADTDVGHLNVNGRAPTDDSVRGQVNPFAPLVDAAIELMNGPNTLSVGFSPGVASGGSISVRDADHDGRLELCVKASSDPVTLGFCIEP